MKKDKEVRPLQWHPAFYAGIRIELAHVQQQVHLENEHQLGTKPKEIDVLIVKKHSEEVIDNNIGRMFRKHNLVEYKSPEDYFSIDDFYFWLRHLTNNIKDTETARKLLTEYQKHKDNKLYESLMDIIVRANWKVFSEVNGMCKALEELMKDELDAREARGIEKGIEHGIKAVIEVCRSLGASWDAALEMLAEQFHLTQGDTERYMKLYW